MAGVRVEPLYDRSSLTGLESDVRTVSEAWFGHDVHTSVVCSLPSAYFRFHAHDRYGGSTRYEMDALFRVFVLKELRGWEHETALADYLDHRSDLRGQLDFEMVPDQSTLWRSWHNCSTVELCETVQNVARTILIKAQNADVTVPHEPERSLPPRGDDADESNQERMARDELSYRSKENAEHDDHRQ